MPANSSAVISALAGLPPWDTLFNAPGGGLAEALPLDQAVALGVRTPNAPVQDVHIVTTDATTRDPLFSGLYLKVARQPGFRVLDPVRVTPDLLNVLRSQDTTGNAEAKDESGMHDKWDGLLAEALRQGTSDLHLRVVRGSATLRFRVNGELRPPFLTTTEAEGMAMAHSMFNTMTDRRSTKDEFDPRAQQSASVTRVLSNGKVRLRYEGLPIEPDGTDVTLRVFDMRANAKARSAMSLGYSQDQSDAINRAFARSSGMILFLGPTGSGKSTSSASMLTALTERKPDKLLRTLEEPVEIVIPRASQTMLARHGDESGTNQFNMALSALMRADPDYLMVGEIRDIQTVNLAIQGVRTGHLLVSTLHANGASAAIGRLRGLGVPSVDLADPGLLAGLIYQRLMPVLCEHCKIPAAAKQDDPHYADVVGRLRTYMRAHHPDDTGLNGFYFRDFAGCDVCGHTGITGRTAVAEVLTPNSLPMLEAIRADDMLALRKLWRATGDPNDPACMRGRTAFEHARWKAEQGIVSPLDVEELQPFDEDPL
ncbi:MAG TPA: ATPase, T2SS/T4P/T4SS family [Rhodanobacteraceae bacterium]